MDQEWKNLIIVLKGIHSKDTLISCCSAITELLVVEDLPEVFHSVVFDCIFDDRNEITTQNGSALLKEICHKFQRYLSNLLLNSDSDGDILQFSEIDVDCLLKAKNFFTKSSSDEPDTRDIGKDKTTIYRKKWFEKQKVRIKKLINSNLIPFDDTLNDIADISEADLGNNLKSKPVGEIVESTSIKFSGVVSDITAETWFARLFRFLIVTLTNPNWASRYAAAIALSSIIKGLFKKDDLINSLKLPKFLLNDILTIGSTVLILDRFIDFEELVTKEEQTKLSRISTTNIININKSSGSNKCFPVKMVVTKMLNEAMLLMHQEYSFPHEAFLNNILKIAKHVNDWSVSYGGLQCIAQFLERFPISSQQRVSLITDCLAVMHTALTSYSILEIYEIAYALCNGLCSSLQKASDDVFSLSVDESHSLCRIVSNILSHLVLHDESSELISINFKLSCKIIICICEVYCSNYAGKGHQKDIESLILKTLDCLVKLLLCLRSGSTNDNHVEVDFIEALQSILNLAKIAAVSKSKQFSMSLMESLMRLYQACILPAVYSTELGTTKERNEEDITIDSLVSFKVGVTDNFQLAMQSIRGKRFWEEVADKWIELLTFCDSFSIKELLDNTQSIVIRLFMCESSELILKESHVSMKRIVSILAADQKSYFTTFDISRYHDSLVLFQVYFMNCSLSNCVNESHGHYTQQGMNRLLSMVTKGWKRVCSLYEQAVLESQQSIKPVSCTTAISGPPKKKLRIAISGAGNITSILPELAMSSRSSNSDISSNQNLLPAVNQLHILVDTLISSVLESKNLVTREFQDEYLQFLNQLPAFSNSTAEILQYAHTKLTEEAKASHDLQNLLQCESKAALLQNLLAVDKMHMLKSISFVANRILSLHIQIHEPSISHYVCSLIQDIVPNHTNEWNPTVQLIDRLCDHIVVELLDQNKKLWNEQIFHGSLFEAKEVSFYRRMYCCHKLISYFCGANNEANATISETYLTESIFVQLTEAIISCISSYYDEIVMLEGEKMEFLIVDSVNFLSSMESYKYLFYKLLNSLGVIIMKKLSIIRDINKRTSLGSIYWSMIDQVGEIIAVAAFEPWLTIGIQGIGDYQRTVRLYCVAGFRLLVPLAPLAINLVRHQQDSSVVNAPAISANILLQELLTKSTPSKLNDSSHPLDQKIVCSLKRLNPIYCSTGKETTNVKVPKLREYQWEGITWWTMLRRCGLSGILADEMGLGKTLQALSCLGILRIEKLLEQFPTLHETISPTVLTNLETYTFAPTLIVCPASLTFHWKEEIEKYFQSSHLFQPILCNAEFFQTKNYINMIKQNVGFHQSNVFIISYDMLRKYSSSLQSIIWEMVILDEAHVIRNPSTSIASSVFQLQVRYRLAISGTPIQNQVDDIWSLMNFLMPDYLGEYQTFRKQFVNPIKASVQSLQWLKTTHSPSSSSQSKQKEFSKALEISGKGIELLRKLHKQVLPFILRRVKEDCVRDLPKKTIIDIMCPLSAIQNKMYSDFQKKLNLTEEQLEVAAKRKLNLENSSLLPANHTKKSGEINDENENEQEEEENMVQLYEEIIRKKPLQNIPKPGGKRAVQLPLPVGYAPVESSVTTMNPLQALNCLQLLSIHPALVLDSTKHVAYHQKLINSIDSSGKFQNLMKLLLDCQILSVEDDYDSREYPSGQDFYNALITDVEEQPSTANPTLSLKEQSNNGEDINSSESESDDEEHDDKSATNKKPNAMSSKAINLHEKEKIESVKSSPSVSKKCLIFAQHKKCLDLIEECILQRFFPQVKYARLDGSVAPEKRFQLATQFNQRSSSTKGKGTVAFKDLAETDAVTTSEANVQSILKLLHAEVAQQKEQDNEENPVRILLLTTRSSGLGLNLSAADTVIFVEHDWNPFVDLQAMDRVHRLGQENPVSVYRLIADSSVESRILSLQAFKSKLSEEIVEGESTNIAEASSWKQRSLGQELWTSLTS